MFFKCYTGKWNKPLVQNELPDDFVWLKPCEMKPDSWRITDNTP